MPSGSKFIFRLSHLTERVAEARIPRRDDWWTRHLQGHTINKHRSDDTLTDMPYSETRAVVRVRVRRIVGRTRKNETAIRVRVVPGAMHSTTWDPLPLAQR